MLQVSREDRIEDVLATQGAAYRKRREQKQNQSEEEQRMAEMQSKMGPYSQLLVQMMETRKNESTEQRLRKPTRAIKESTMQALEKMEDEHSFIPEIHFHPSQVSKDRDQKPVYQELYDARDEFYVKRQAMANAQRELVERECTFQPNLNHDTEMHREGQTEQSGQLLDRLYTWKAENDARLESRRREMVELAMKQAVDEFGAEVVRNLREQIHGMPVADQLAQLQGLGLHVGE